MSKAPYFGVISTNMIKRVMLKQDAQGKESIQIHECGKDLLQPQNTVVVQCSASGEGHHKVNSLPGRHFTTKQIKTVLINEVAMTLDDLETIRHADIPVQSIIYLHKIHLASNALQFSVFPSLSPTDSLFRRLALSMIADGPSTVIWTIMPSMASMENEFHYLCLEGVTYQQFLIHYCKRVLGIKRQGPIEFELFVFLNPIIFGRASCGSEHSFFFTRMVSCSVMVQSHAHHHLH